MYFVYQSALSLMNSIGISEETMMNTNTRNGLAALGLMTMTAFAAPAMAGDVTITIDAVQARGGNVLIGLQTQAQFLQSDGAYGEQLAAPTAGTHIVVLKDVAPGDYSVGVLHDADGNRTMTMDGSMPAEGWAILNGESLRGMPTFDQVKFTVPSDGTSIRVAMAYPASR